MDRNQPADAPLLLCPTLIFISCPRSGASSVNLSSAPFSKLSFSFSSLRSPVCTDTQIKLQRSPEEEKEPTTNLNGPPTEGWSQSQQGGRLSGGGGQAVCGHPLYFSFAVICCELKPVLTTDLKKKLSKDGFTLRSMGTLNASNLQSRQRLMCGFCPGVLTGLLISAFVQSPHPRKTVCIPHPRLWSPCLGVPVACPEIGAEPRQLVWGI